MSNKPKAVKQRLNVFFSSPKTTAKVVDIADKRPLCGSRRLKAPYYKRRYAEQVKAVVDRMLQCGDRHVYRYDKWCNKHTQMSKRTLYTRINQSIRFLIEQLDTPDHRYTKWYECARIYRRAGVGVVIEFIPGLHGGEWGFFREVLPGRKCLAI